MTKHSSHAEPLSYRAAGVDIEAGQALVQSIKGIAKRTHRPEVIGGLGGFAALCELPSGYHQPVLVSSTDGVGTKLRLAMDCGIHDTIGIDLVAMCVNDILVVGAEPLFFLDYYATGRLDVATAASVLMGIGRGCEQAACALVGGETAEMPGMYQGDDYDLAGFSVGVVEKNAIIDGSAVRAGDAIIALASSGAHANGYSLIRQIIARSAIDLTASLGAVTLAEALLMPTRIYVQAVRSLMSHCRPHALCHITGGGVLENLPRVLPTDMQAVIHSERWTWPPLFTWLQEQGQLETMEMYRTFNCGIGMLVVVAEDAAQAAITQLNKTGEQAWLVGRIEAAEETQPPVVFC